LTPTIHIPLPPASGSGADTQRPSEARTRQPRHPGRASLPWLDREPCPCQGSAPERGGSPHLPRASHVEIAGVAENHHAHLGRAPAAPVPAPIATRPTWPAAPTVSMPVALRPPSPEPVPLTRRVSPAGPLPSPGDPPPPPGAIVHTPHLAADTPPADESPARRIVRDLRPRARVLAVASGKGGVGKTNLAVNLALALAGAGRRVLLVDADLGLANVDLVLGQPRPAGSDLAHVLAGRVPLERIVQEGPAGIHWIPGASHVPQVAAVDDPRREALLDGLTALERVHDFLLLDTPAGIGGGVLHLARQADEVLLVTTPEPPAMMDAYALLKAVRASATEPIGPVRLIVNMVTHRHDARRVHERLREAATRFLGIDVGLLGYVFCDGHVGRAVQKREPLMLAYPHSQASWCVKRLAGAILEGSDASGQGGFAFFRRLANLFGGGSR